MTKELEYSSVKKEEISDFDEDDNFIKIKKEDIEDNYANDENWQQEKLFNDNTNDEYFEKATIKCNRCKLGFKTKDEYQQHCNKMHKKQKQSNSSFQCDVCEEVFQLRKELRKHKIDVHNLKEKIKQQTDQDFTCDECGNRYTSNKSLNRHKKKHATNGFKCQSCSEGFATLNDLQMHTETNHPGPAAFCNICNKLFANKSNYKVHYRVFHDTDVSAPIHTCELCGKWYKTRSEYCRHVKSHEGFSCHQCGQIFRYADKLKYHMYTHTGEKPFSCTFCEKKFRKKIYLTEHLRTHTKERPFVCSVCGKGFTQRSPLKIHMRSHTGERPYKCRICNHGCISKNYLKIHMQSSHNSTDV